MSHGFYSIVNPDSVGSRTFSWIRIQILIPKYLSCFQSQQKWRKKLLFSFIVQKSSVDRSFKLWFFFLADSKLLFTISKLAKNNCGPIRIRISENSKPDQDWIISDSQLFFVSHYKVLDCFISFLKCLKCSFQRNGTQFCYCTTKKD